MLYLKSTYCPSDNLVTGVISEFLFPGSVLDQRQTYLTTANAILVDKNTNTLFCLIFSCSVIIVSLIVARSKTKTPPANREVGKFKNPLKNINLIIVVVALFFAATQASQLAKCTDKIGRKESVIVGAFL